MAEQKNVTMADLKQETKMKSEPVPKVDEKKTEKPVTTPIKEQAKPASKENTPIKSPISAMGASVSPLQPQSQEVMKS